MTVMLENRVFLSNTYFFIHSTKQTVCLKSYYVLGTPEDTELRKTNCPGVVYTGLCGNDTHTPVYKTRQKMCVSLCTYHKVVDVLVNG